MAARDWTAAPLAEAPVGLGAALEGSRLAAVETRPGRVVRLRFELSPDAGTREAFFVVRDATHLLSFVYLPPAEPLPADASPEEVTALVSGWARTGLIATDDPLRFETACVVARAALHVMPDAQTLSVEGYGEDADRLVWWEVRISGRQIEALDERGS